MNIIRAPSSPDSVSSTNSPNPQDFQSFGSPVSFQHKAPIAGTKMSGFSNTSHGNDQLGGNQTNNVSLSLTDDQLSQLMTILNVGDDAINIARQDPTTPKKIASSWPEWDGSKELYPTYIIQLAAKIDTDWDLLGGNKAYRWTEPRLELPTLHHSLQRQF